MSLKLIPKFIAWTFKKLFEKCNFLVKEYREMLKHNPDYAIAYYIIFGVAFTIMFAAASTLFTKEIETIFVSIICILTFTFLYNLIVVLWESFISEKDTSE